MLSLSCHPHAWGWQRSFRRQTRSEFEFRCREANDVLCAHIGGEARYAATRPHIYLCPVGGGTEQTVYSYGSSHLANIYAIFDCSDTVSSCKVLIQIKSSHSSAVLKLPILHVSHAAGPG